MTNDVARSMNYNDGNIALEDTANGKLTDDTNTQGNNVVQAETTEKGNIDSNIIEDKAITESQHKCYLYLSNLPQNVTEDDLKEIFSEFPIEDGEPARSTGLISAKVNRDATTGLSRCSGFVNFSKPEEAEEILKKMQNTMVLGKKVILKRYIVGGSKGQRTACNTFVSQLPVNCCDQELRTAMEQFGPVRSVYLPPDTSYGYVEFEDDNGANAAIEAGKVPVGDTHATVGLYVPFLQRKKVNMYHRVPQNNVPRYPQRPKPEDGSTGGRPSTPRNRSVPGNQYRAPNYPAGGAYRSDYRAPEGKVNRQYLGAKPNSMATPRLHPDMIEHTAILSSLPLIWNEDLIKSSLSMYGPMVDIIDVSDKECMDKKFLVVMEHKPNMENMVHSLSNRCLCPANEAIILSQKDSDILQMKKLRHGNTTSLAIRRLDIQKYVDKGRNNNTRSNYRKPQYRSDTTRDTPNVDPEQKPTTMDI